MIKRYITNTLLVVLAITVLMLLSITEHTYKREVIVNKVNANTNEITVVDKNYNVWTFYDDDTTQYTIGQEIIVVMNDNTTDSIITDDRIVDVK